MGARWQNVDGRVATRGNTTRSPRQGLEVRREHGQERSGARP